MNTEKPATTLGSWVAMKRKAAGYVISQAAGLLRLGPAKYTELECGIGKWLTADHVSQMSILFGLDAKDKAHLTALQKKVASSDLVRFKDVFSRDQLEPIRLRHYNKKRLTNRNEKETILDQVFAETV